MSWGNLLNPDAYGAEEYGIVLLIFFIIVVAVKHLIFHTIYHWWYGAARLYLPARFWNIVTGKSLPQRLLEYVNAQNDKVKSVSAILGKIERYSGEKEFALTLGKDKGEILDKIVEERKPTKVLVCGSMCGYSVLRILRSSPEKVQLILIESDTNKCSVAKTLCTLAGYGSQVTVLSSHCATALPKLKESYGFDKVDFVFLTSTALGEPHYDRVIRLLEKLDLLHCEIEGDLQTVVLADKVVHFGESEFLKYVRYSDNYDTEYFQVPLEYSPIDIVDGMEKATYVG